LGDSSPVLRDPQIVIAEITKQRMEANGSADSASLDNDIKTLEKKLYEYDKRRNNLLEAMELGEFDKDEILDRLNNLKLLSSEDETKLKQLLEIKANISSLEGAQVKLDEVYDTVLENIENCPDDVKKLALDALDIKVNASIDNVEIHGVLPLALPTIEQTWGCLISCTYDYPSGKEAVSILPKDDIMLRDVK